LQAVDGVALKVLVDRWAAASTEARSLAFEAAFVVRQIEIGLAALLSLASGLTLLVFGLAIVLSRRYPVWLGGLGRWLVWGRSRRGQRRRPPAFRGAL
jgi:hypothetical protein